MDSSVASRIAHLAHPVFVRHGWTYGAGEKPSVTDLTEVVAGLLHRIGKLNAKQQPGENCWTETGRFRAQSDLCEGEAEPEISVYLRLGGLDD